MKKATIFLCILMCLGVFCACNAQDEIPDADILNPYFTGKVIEKLENGCLMEVTDMGNTGFAIEERLIVNTDISNCPAYAVGDYLKVSFDGKVALSYPGQILNVFIISKVDGNT